MRGITLLCVLVALPALIALGHDAYLYYENQDKGLRFADVGYIWALYHEESLRWAAQNLDETTKSVMTYILNQAAVLVGAVFAGAVYMVLIIMKIFALGPFQREYGPVKRRGKRDPDVMLDRDKRRGNMKYNRR